MSKDHHPNDDGLGGIAATLKARVLRTQACSEVRVRRHADRVKAAIIGEIERQNPPYQTFEGHDIKPCDRYDMDAVALAAIRAMGATE